MFPRTGLRNNGLMSSNNLFIGLLNYFKITFEFKIIILEVLNDHVWVTLITSHHVFVIYNRV